MKTPHLILAHMLLVLYPLISASQIKSAPAESTMVISNYKVDASAPFFSKAKLWIVFGGAPDQFTLYEQTWPRTDGEGFSYLLIDNGGKKWMEIYSDTSNRSTVQLPDDTAKTLKSDGVAFISALRKMFADTNQHYMTGKVTLGDTALYASAAELESSIPRTRRFIVRTYNDTETFIDGEVIVDYQQCSLVYKQVNVFVNKSGVKLKLTILANE